MNSENLQNQLDRIEALLKIQVADTSALLFLLGDLTENLPDGEKKRKEMEKKVFKDKEKVSPQPTRTPRKYPARKSSADPRINR